MKKKKYLTLYYEWMESGKLPTDGLCNYFGSPEAPGVPNVHDEFKEFELMIPKVSVQDRNGGFWGTVNRDKIDRHRTFCPLRQNIVLFLAAMNNEL